MSFLFHKKIKKPPTVEALGAAYPSVKVRRFIVVLYYINETGRGLIRPKYTGNQPFAKSSRSKASAFRWQALQFRYSGTTRAAQN